MLHCAPVLQARPYTSHLSWTRRLLCYKARQGTIFDTRSFITFVPRYYEQRSMILWEERQPRGATGGPDGQKTCQSCRPQGRCTKRSRIFSARAVKKGSSTNSHPIDPVRAKLEAVFYTIQDLRKGEARSTRVMGAAYVLRTNTPRGGTISAYSRMWNNKNIMSPVYEWDPEGELRLGGGGENPWWRMRPAGPR